MAIIFYNTLTRKKQEFKPIEDSVVKIYSCGPTVYDYAHLGNFRSFIFVDLLRRFLRLKGFALKHVMNVTDVDDKTIKRSQEQGKSLQEFTEFYSEEFFKDLETLNISRPETIINATDNIGEMVALIRILLDKGVAYKAKDGCIYFSIAKFPDYGKLANLDVANLLENADKRMASDEYEKENARDFALWKSWDESDGAVFWETELGKGRPGWHIECSAMSTKNLGKTFDIHTGGVDLIFPHHTNEIAQSEAATGKKFVNFWMHNEHLLVDGKKMSKSLGNFYTLRDLLKKGIDPKAIRWLLLSTHYRQQLNFTMEAVHAAEAAVERLLEFMRNLREYNADIEYNEEVDDMIEKTSQAFVKELDDDLGMPAALSHIFDFVRDINKLMLENRLDDLNAKAVVAQMEDFDKILGVLEEEEIAIPEEIQELAAKREKARADKDWKESDKLRDLIKEKGFFIEDAKKGTKIKKLV